jgi:hypothetical protein
VQPEIQCLGNGERADRQDHTRRKSFDHREAPLVVAQMRAKPSEESMIDHAHITSAVIGLSALSLE